MTMDVSAHLTIRPAPCAVLDALPARADQVRFRVRKPDNSWGAVTWGEFGAQIRSAAALLIDAGVEPGDRVAVFGGNSVAWAAAALGVQAAGAVMVPIYPASTAAQAAYVLGHAACKAVFVSSALRDRAPDIRSFDLDDPATFAAGLALERAHPARVQARLDSIAPA
jgi:long-chain acyl-CoA synthetase